MQPHRLALTRDRFRRACCGLGTGVVLLGLGLLVGPGEAAARAARPAVAPPAADARRAREPAPLKRDRLRPNAAGEIENEDVFTIEGKVYKPEVFVFLGRKNLNLDWDLDDPRFKRSFLESVVKAVSEAPF
jgi:hypothetical protein